MSRRLLVTATVSALVLGVIGVAAANFSDFATIGGNRVGAGTLVLSESGDLAVTVAAASEASSPLQVTTTGTTPARLGLSLELAPGTGLCDVHEPSVDTGRALLFLDGHDTEGAPTSVQAGDLCGDLTDLAWPGVDILDPGGVDTAAITLRVVLDEDLPGTWVGKQAAYDMTITGDQPGGGFSDFTVGTFTVTIDGPTRTVHEDCPGTASDYRLYYELPSGRHELDLSDETGPAYVIALNGTKKIWGTSSDDCIVVGNGNMLVYAGGGNDTIVSEHPNGTAAGGGTPELYGEAGDDLLIARNGNAQLDGGSGENTCIAPAATEVVSCDLEPTDGAVLHGTSNSELSIEVDGAAVTGDDPDDGERSDDDGPIDPVTDGADGDDASGLADDGSAEEGDLGASSDDGEGGDDDATDAADDVDGSAERGDDADASDGDGTGDGIGDGTGDGIGDGTGGGTGDGPDDGVDDGDIGDDRDDGDDGDGAGSADDVASAGTNG